MTDCGARSCRELADERQSDRERWLFGGPSAGFVRRCGDVHIPFDFVLEPSINVVVGCGATALVPGQSD